MYLQTGFQFVRYLSMSRLMEFWSMLGLSIFEALIFF